VALAETLIDDFNDNSTNTSVWNGNYNGTGNTVTETNSQVTIVLSGTSGAYSAYSASPAAPAYDLTNSYASVQACVVSPDTATSTQNYMKVAAASNNYLAIGKQGANLYMQMQTAGVDSTTNITFDRVQHSWWRLQGSGTDILFQTSPDGFRWTTQRTVTPSFGFTAVWLEVGAGTFALETTPGSFVFDNFNNPVSQMATQTYNPGRTWINRFAKRKRNPYTWITPLNQQYTVDLTASLTPSGSLTKQVNKSFTASITPSGALAKTVLKSLTASLSPSGVLNKKVFKNLTASLSPSGLLTSSRVYIVNLTASLSPSGSLNKQVRKSLTASLSPAGALNKRIARTLTASLSPAGVLNKQVRKTLSAGLSFVGSIAGLIRTSNTYYVSATGSDSNDGLTTSTPWQTITKVNASSFSPGDVISFKGGDTFTGNLQINNSGSTGRPITYTSYGTGKATIANTAGHGITAVDKQYITISNLTITGTGTAYTGSYTGLSFFAFTAGTYHSISLSGLDISGFTYGCSFGATDATKNFDTISVTNSVFHDNRDNGFLIYGQDAFTGANYIATNATISNCTAYNNVGNAANTTSHTGDGIDFGRVNGGTIDGCTAYNNGANNACAAEGPVGIMTYHSNNVTIQNCLAYSNKSGTAIDGDGIDIDLLCTNCTVQYCMSYNNVGAGILSWGSTSGNVIRYNICWGNGKNTLGTPFGEIALGSSGTYSSIDVYNNTVIAQDFTTSPPALYITGTPSGVTVRNNIFYAANGSNVTTTANFTTGQVLLQGNNYYRDGGELFSWNGTSYISLSTFRAALAGQETVTGSASGYTISPGLHNPLAQPTITAASNLTTQTDYELQDTSSLIGKGLNLNTLFGTNVGSRDFFGNALSSVFDIGASISHYVTPPIFTPLVATIKNALSSLIVRGASGTSTDKGAKSIATLGGTDTIRDIEGQTNNTTVEGQKNNTNLG
jgi:hypothetical protein